MPSKTPFSLEIGSPQYAVFVQFFREQYAMERSRERGREACEKADKAARREQWWTTFLKGALAGFLLAALVLALVGPPAL